MEHIPQTMRTTARLKAPAPVHTISMDRVIRFVLLPLVMAVGLYGLIYYAVTGEGGTTVNFDRTLIETPVLP